jgi:hypothetical protein
VFEGVVEHDDVERVSDLVDRTLQNGWPAILEMDIPIDEDVDAQHLPEASDVQAVQSGTDAAADIQDSTCCRER